MLIVATLPRSGTRFANAFLDAIGVPSKYEHLDDIGHIENLLPGNPKFLFTDRDPLLIWMSNWMMRNDKQDRSERITKEVVLMLRYRDFLAKDYEHEYLRINCPVDEREDELRKVHKFVGGRLPVSEFEWKSIGVSNKETGPTKFEMWNEVVRPILKPEELSYLADQLGEFRERFGHDGDI